MSQPASVRALRVGALALVAVSCSAGGKKASETAAAATSAGAVAASAHSLSTMAALPGALAKPVDQYSVEDLYLLTRRLVFTGGVERDRRCKGSAACAGARPRTVTRLRVDAVEGEDSLSAAAIPANGVIAARLLNRGAATDAVYGTAPGRLEYFLIVLPGRKAGTATWRLEQLDMSGPRRAHRSVATGSFRECHHAFVRGARADFKTCDEAALVHQAALVLPQTTSDSPVWIGCATGCCTADPTGTT